MNCNTHFDFLFWLQNVGTWLNWYFSRVWCFKLNRKIITLNILGMVELLVIVSTEARCLLGS